MSWCLRVSFCVAWAWSAATATFGQEEGYRPLFNGEDLTGWEGRADLWRVEDGAIVGETTADAPIDKNTFLVFRGESFSDFELRLSFRIESGNSGIQYRSQLLDDTAWVVGGYQADLCAPTAGQEWIPGICYDEKGRGILARRGQTVRITADGKRTADRREPESRLMETFRTDGWNDYVIRADGPRLEHWINGVLSTVVIDEQRDAREAEGILALQLHQGPPMKVQFRDLRIRAIASRPVLVESPIVRAGDPGQSRFDGGPKPQWLWGDEGDESILLRRTFDWSGTDAHIVATCDNVMTVRVNGKDVATSGDWGTPSRVDVTRFLRAGENVLEVEAQNEGGPAGFAAKLVWKDDAGNKQALATDAAWRVVDGDAARAPRVVGAMGDSPWGDVFGKGGLHVDTVKHLPGFQLELLYQVPKATEGSWVSITPDGSDPSTTRFFTSDQYGGIFRVTPGEPTTVERLETPVGKAHGMLWAFDSLYVMGAGPDGTGFYRLRDTTGDGALDSHAFLAGFNVGSEHSAHAIHLSPDGKSLFIVAGNMTKLPDAMGPSPRHRWANDFLIPNELPPSGHNAGGKPLGGYVVETDPDGTSFRMLCGGFRNPYDMAFNRDGELFVYDSDMEYDGGAPWYRPTRVLHALSGADFGWRRGAGKWPAYYADSFGSVIDIGQGSPTGVLFGYGAAFPAKYQNALYLLDWTYGRIRAVHITPDGASYSATAEDFLVGRPLPLTDATIGADGAMYLLVGGRRTESRMFRLTYVGDESTEPVPTEGETRGQRARVARRNLEALHHPVGGEAVAQAWPSLASRDRALRHAARLVLEHQPLELWRSRALNEPDGPTRVTALVALSRVGTSDDRRDVLASLADLDFTALPTTARLESLRAWSLAFTRLGPADAADVPALRARFESVFPTGHQEIDRELARLLVSLESTAIIEGALAKMDRSPVQEEQMYYANLLRLVADGWTVEQRREYFRWINEGRFRLTGSAAFDAGGYFHYQGGRSFRPYVEVIGERAREHLTDRERADPELAALLAATAPPPRAVDDSTLALQAQPVAWQVQDLLPALARLSRGRSFERGRAAYHAVRCADCHSHGAFTADAALGPDLTLAAGRFSGHDLLESILEPSKEVSDQYADRSVWTTTGLLHTGIVLSDDATGVTIKPDADDDEVVFVPRAEIDEVETSKTSRMPRDLLNVLDEEQILDLLAYVLSGGDPSDAAFRRDDAEE